MKKRAQSGVAYSVVPLFSFPLFVNVIKITIYFQFFVLLFVCPPFFASPKKGSPKKGAPKEEDLLPCTFPKIWLDERREMDKTLNVPNKEKTPSFEGAGLSPLPLGTYIITDICN